MESFLRLTTALIIVACVLGVVGCPRSQGPCKKDSDCSKGMLCEGEVCKPAGVVERSSPQIGPAGSSS